MIKNKIFDDISLALHSSPWSFLAFLFFIYLIFLTELLLIYQKIID